MERDREMRRDKPLVAILGLAGWYEHGTPYNYSRGPLALSEVKAPILIDKSAALAAADSPVGEVWSMPSLDCSLPAGNVRDLLEGCIGCAGTLDGHAWDGGQVSCAASVGINVYVELNRRAGYVVTER